MFTLENIPIIRNATVCNRSQQIGSVVWTGPKTIKFQIVNFYFKFIYRTGPWIYLREFVKPSVENELKIFVKVYFYWLWNFLIKHIFDFPPFVWSEFADLKWGKKLKWILGKKICRSKDLERFERAVVVAQLVERSLSTPEIRGSRLMT